MSDKHKEAVWGRISAETIPTEQGGEKFFVELSEDALDQAAGGVHHGPPEDSAGDELGKHETEDAADRPRHL